MYFLVFILQLTNNLTKPLNVIYLYLCLFLFLYHRMSSNHAVSAVEEESHDLCHCSVCFEQFDAGEHKPKFLGCHHTMSMKCIKVT